MAEIFENNQNLENKNEESKERHVNFKDGNFLEDNNFNTNEKSIENFTNSEKISNELLKDEKNLKDDLEVSLKKLSLLKKEHKKVNNQLHILSHKVQYKIDPLKRKTFSNLNSNARSNSNKNLCNSNSYKDEVSLPRIENKNSTKNIERRSPDQFGIFKNPYTIPKFKYEETKMKILKSKQILEENKQMRMKQAKQVKEANRLMKENVLMLKEKIKEENRQKKKIVDTKYEFIKNSISNFQKLKQEYIKNIISTDIEKETKEIKEKIKQLESLKEIHEKNLKMKKRNKEERGNDKTFTPDGSNRENQSGIYKFEESKNEEKI